MFQIINKKVFFISVFILVLPYLFRIFNVDLFLIKLLSNKKGNIEKEHNKNQKEIFLGYVEFYPYTYTNHENVADGIFIQKSKKIFNELPDYKLNYISLPANRLFEGLKNGSIQLFIGIRTIPVLQEFVISTESKVGSIEMRIYSFDKNINIKNKEDLLGKKIILVKGYGYSGWADFLKERNSPFVVEALDHEIAFEMLLRNRGEYLLEYKEPAEDVINKFNLKNLNFVSLMVLDCYFIISKKYPNSENLRNLIDKVYRNF